MVVNNDLIRVFWPSDISRQYAPGVLVGFKNGERDIFIVTVLHKVELRSVQNALAVGTLLRNSPYDVRELLQRCGHTSLHAVGLVNAENTNGHIANLLRFSTDPFVRFPKLQSSHEAAVMAQIIIYNRPHPIRMQYLSMSPISLALGDRTSAPPRDIDVEEVDMVEEVERRRKAALVAKLRLHKVISRPPSGQELMLPVLIEQVNCSFELDGLLRRNIGMIGRRMKRSMSVSESISESANDLWDYLYVGVAYVVKIWLWPVVGQTLIIGLIAHRIVSEAVLRILHWCPELQELPALKDVSATAQQVDIRLQQSCYWPIQYLTLRKRKKSWDSITSSHPEYIRFYNSLWLVANDIIMGVALGSYIIENATQVAAQFNTIFNEWSVEGLRRMITWLTGWPGGLKLNTELADFLGELFLWVIDYWAGCISALQPHLPMLIKIIGLSAFGGATMPISIFSDLLSLLTLHIHSFYVASARIFNWQLSIIISLFHLFRGKKRNVLRHRIDSCDYALDQLLLGTVLFTLQFFLLPTVFVFYLLFAAARVLVIASKAILEMGLACLNHFPLFAVMLRIKDPGRLPGGICFELLDTLKDESSKTGPGGITPTAYVLLKSVPLSLRVMFQPYFELGDRIIKHYFSPRVLLYLASGQQVPPIHRRNLYSLQYSMLPEHRSGISELWQKLTEQTSVHAQETAPRSYASMQSERVIMNGNGKKYM